MKQLDGLYFFQMSQGEYSDYRGDGLYVSDHPITEQEWHEFCMVEVNIRREKQVTCWPKSIGMSSTTESQKQWREYLVWLRGRKSMEDMFVEKHNLTPVECTELHLDY